MFAYCGNNPVIRVDDGGELWNIIAGVVIGAVVNVAISAITNKMAGNDYTLQDAVSDAITGGITGGMAASGLGVVAQAAGNALVGMADTAIDIYRENGTITLNDADDLFISAGLGFMFGYYGGNGLANSSRAMKQIIIIDANMHCLARASAKNTVVSCIKHISDDIIENGVKFISSSVFANSIAAVQQK